LLFIDLDGFKEVNDSLGHAQGDQVLSMVAARLSLVTKAEVKPGSMRQPLLARLAGDEFTMLFPDVCDSAEADRLANAALAALVEPFETAGRIIDMGASVGVALCPVHGTDLTTLMKAADIAMYCAKGSGRSQARLYHPALAATFDLRAPAPADARRSSQPRAVRISRA
jgi:diguanylate cyclase (GGDEF)-like protein